MVLFPSPVYAQYRAQRLTEHIRCEKPVVDKTRKKNRQLWKTGCLNYDDKENDLNITVATEAIDGILSGTEEEENEWVMLI